MIYCVIPEALSDELFQKMTDYYAEDPNVEVIVDRRKVSRRQAGQDASEAEQRTVRDRRRARVTGDFPDTPAAEH